MNRGTRLRPRDVESGKHSIESNSEENILPIDNVKVAGGHKRDGEMDKNGIMFSMTYVIHALR